MGIAELAEPAQGRDASQYAEATDYRVPVDYIEPQEQVITVDVTNLKPSLREIRLAQHEALVGFIAAILAAKTPLTRLYAFALAFNLPVMGGKSPWDVAKEINISGQALCKQVTALRVEYKIKSQPHCWKKRKHKRNHAQKIGSEL